MTDRQRLDADAAALYDAATSTFNVPSIQRQDMPTYRQNSIDTMVATFDDMLPNRQTKRMLAEGYDCGMNELTLFMDETISFRDLIKATIPALQAIVTPRFGADVVVRWREHVDPYEVEVSRFGTLVCDWSGQTGEYIGAPDLGRIHHILNKYNFKSLDNAFIASRIPSEPPPLQTLVHLTRQSIPNTLVHRNLAKRGYDARYLHSTIDAPGPAPQTVNRFKRKIQDMHTEIEQLESEFNAASSRKNSKRSRSIAQRIDMAYMALREVERDANLVVASRPAKFCVCPPPFRCKSVTGTCPSCNLDTTEDGFRF